MKQKFFALVLYFLMVELTGCTIAATHDGMSVSNLSTINQYPYSVSISSIGAGDYFISSTNLKAAIESSIIKNNLFNRVIQGNNGDYELTVTVLEQSKPAFGIDFTINLNAFWLLVKTSDKSIILKENIQSSYTAEFSDSILGYERFRLAEEGAVRKNISQGIQAISNLLSDDLARRKSESIKASSPSSLPKNTFSPSCNTDKDCPNGLICKSIYPNHNECAAKNTLEDKPKKSIPLSDSKLIPNPQTGKLE